MEWRNQVEKCQLIDKSQKKSAADKRLQKIIDNNVIEQEKNVECWMLRVKRMVL